MRPLKIELDGFLSYREPAAIDLSDVRAAAILGPNGAGKTSLIEAIGWALYGKGRFRSPDAYVSVGKTNCRVTVEFEITGERFRVMRERRIGAGARSDLTFAAEMAPGQWSPMGGATIAETQAAIVEVVGMEHETWEATSYIAQGRADAFTQLTPAKRKELLHDVFELERYEVLAAKAKEQERTEAGTAIALAQRVEQLEADAMLLEGAEARVATAERARGEAESKVGVLTLQVEGAQRAYDRAREAAAAGAVARDRLLELRQRRETDVARLEAQLARSETALAEHRAAIAHQDQVVAKLGLSEQLASTLEHEATEKQHLAESAEASATEKANAREARRQEAAATTAKLDQSRAAGDQLRERIDLLVRTRDASCFACGQELPSDLRDELVLGLTAEVEANQQAARDLSDQRSDALNAATEHERHHRALKQKAEIAARQAQDIAQRLAVAMNDRGRLPTEQAQLERMRTQEAELQAQVDADLAELKASGERFREEEERALAGVAATKEAEDQQAASAGQLGEAQRSLEHAQEAWYRSGVELGAANEQLALVRASVAELERQSTELTRIQTLAHRWARIAEMFGRDGIPALIVENAVPEIEASANRWLERLAKGRLTVRIDSLRANKTGGLRETLDITVADGEDERPLEGFSGGERQRVNLALRLALSEVLAARAGHPIEALILDEAFTALDAEGRQLAIEVIRALEDTFDITLFVTHLGDLAEAFPQRIVVTRAGEPSSRTSELELVT